MPRALRHRLTDARAELSEATGVLRPSLLRARMARSRERLAAVRLRPELVNARITDGRSRLDRLWRLAAQLHPDKPLERGYARIGRRADGRVVASAADARAAGALTLHFADGPVDARVERGAAAKATPEQGTLL